MRDRSDSEDDRDSVNVSSLMQTNRSLINRKKQQVQARLSKYQQRLSKVQTLLVNADQPDVAYLQSCMQNLMAKREHVLHRAKEIRRIEEEMDTLKDSVANLDTRPRDTDLTNSNQLEHNKEAQQVEEIRAAKGRLLDELRHLQQKTDQLAENIANKERRLEQLERNLFQKENLVRKVKQTHKKYSQKIVEEEIKLRNFQREIQTQQEKLMITNNSRQRHDLTQHNELLSQIQMLSHAKQQLERQTGQIEMRLRRTLQKLESAEQQLRASRLSESTICEKQKTLEERCQEIAQQYEKALESVAMLKEEEAQLLIRLEQTEQQLSAQTARNDRLVEQDRQLVKIIQSKYAQLQIKLTEVQKCERKLQEFTKHKDEMLHEFQQIQQQKSRLFQAVSEKQAQSRQIEAKKLAMEQRIGKLEQEAHSYQRNFTEYNKKIEEHTNRLVELSDREKATEAYLQALLKDQAEMVCRVAELDRIYCRVCIGVELAGGHPDPKIGRIVRDKVDQLATRIQSLTATEKSLHLQRQLTRKLKLENDNLRALLH